MFAAQYFPFTATSSMRLADGITLPFNLVYGALLYPRVAQEAVGRLRVASMYTKILTGGMEHHWTIMSDDGSLELDALFTTSDKTRRVTGSADTEVILPAGLSETGPSTGYVFQGGYCRGVVRCAAGYKQYVESLPVNLTLEDNALIFDPTVVRFRAYAGFQEVYSPDGDSVSNIYFDENDFTELADGTIVPIITSTTTESTRVPVKRIYVDANTYIEAGNLTQNISIVSKGGCGVKVVNSDIIRLGRGMYV